MTYFDKLGPRLRASLRARAPQPVAEQVAAPRSRSQRLRDAGFPTTRRTESALSIQLRGEDGLDTPVASSRPAMGADALAEAYDRAVHAYANSKRDDGRSLAEFRRDWFRENVPVPGSESFGPWTDNDTALYNAGVIAGRNEAASGPVGGAVATDAPRVTG